MAVAKQGPMDLIVTPSSAASTVGSLLVDGSATTTISGSGMVLDGDLLNRTVQRLGTQLASFGMTASDTIAYLTPPGLDGAILFLAVSSVAAAAPLDPELAPAELGERYELLEPSLVLTRPGSVPHAGSRPVAEIMGRGAALTVDGAGPLAQCQAPGPEDIAVVFTTADPAGEPGLVALSHRELANRAGLVARSQDLDPLDIAVTELPLFEVEGLVEGLLAPLAAGVRVEIS